MKTGKETRWRQRIPVAKKVRIWIHAAIMREQGEIIGKVGEDFLASVFSGLGGGWADQALDM